MQPGVDFRVPLFGLRHAVERVELREDARERTRGAQRAEPRGGRGLAERALRFLPDALRDERVRLARGDHRAHARGRLRRDREAERLEAREEARDAQDPHRVLVEGVRHVPQLPRLEVRAPAVRVDQRAIGVARDRVDREVAALEIVLERDVGRVVQFEAAVAGAGLALGAREGMFLAGLGVQEHREVAPDLAVAEVQHLLRRRADHDPVALADWPAEQLVANRAADQIDFHRIMLRDSPCRPIRLLAAGAACVALSGCYYLHLAEGQMEMNRKREPIEDVIASPDTDATLRRRLELAARARDFAMSDLGLPDNGSYRTYADLGRRYVTWNLFAAPEFSVEPKEWCFPIAGCVSYRGYFDEARATREAGKMRGQGL